MFGTLLIANRGEIACRIAATARRLGVTTVAVYSDADAGAAHVAVCDRAVHIGAAAAVDSYLRIDRIIAAARASGADAIHPGYGFLSENAAFAAACADAGLCFVGPPVHAIKSMGDKRKAKQLMRLASLPLIPGYDGDDESAAALSAQALNVGFPLMIKAAGGGGGRGIRVVTEPAQFELALAACRREAAAAFGDSHVFLERCLASPRHIEVQVFADRHGNCIWLGERDCSAQRRHQKLVEESPAPGCPPALRAHLGQMAVAAARAIGYEGAGTVEFLMAEDGAVFFLEMNTRLQVEHPVTEMVTGLDLVEWQLRVAAGEALALRQEDVQLQGHAIEARVCAEDPERDFLPASGTLRHFVLPAHVAFAVHAPQARGGEPAPVRIDTGLRAGDRITPDYDPLMAKLIAWGRDRDEALARLRRALREIRLVGLSNNVDFLQRLVGSDAFARGAVDTGLVGRVADATPDAAADPDLRPAACAAARVLLDEWQTQSADPWTKRDGWRLNGAAQRCLTLADGTREHDIVVLYRPQGPELRVGTRHGALAVDACDSATVRLEFDGQSLAADVLRDGSALHVFLDGRHHRLTAIEPLGSVDPAEPDEDRLCAPMPGKIIAVHTQAGERVRRGQALLALEAMKMEHVIVAPHDGIVEAVRYRIGDSVQEGETLVSLHGSAGG